MGPDSKVCWTDMLYNLSSVSAFIVFVLFLCGLGGHVAVIYHKPKQPVLCGNGGAWWVSIIVSFMKKAKTNPEKRFCKKTHTPFKALWGFKNISKAIQLHLMNDTFFVNTLLFVK